MVRRKEGEKDKEEIGERGKETYLNKKMIWKEKKMKLRAEKEYWNRNK